MRGLRRIHTLIVAFALTFLCHSHSFAADIAARYSWMLPKTVIDATIAYTFQDCTDNNLKLKITPTLVARTIPDPYVGRLKISPQSLESFWQDGSVSIQTFAGSHILNSIGSSPTSQVAQIGGNILGGIAKLVGLALGVAPVAAVAKKNDPQCWKPDNLPAGSAQAVANRIKELKTKITDLQNQLSNGLDDAAQKKATATIQADQTLIASLQDQLTITVKTTIDPGVSPVDVNPDSDVFQYPTAPRAIPNNGQVARICPSRAQFEQSAPWFFNPDEVFSVPGCAAIPTFEVNVYLDFSHAKGTVHDNDRDYQSGYKGEYSQTTVQDGDLYRDVGYIPIVVWRGVKPATIQPPSADPLRDPVQLMSPQTIPFGQYGVAQTLPFTAKLFQSLTWQITFLENGEITAATFLSKAAGVNATALLGSAVSAANSIAAEQRSAASGSSPSNQATALQGQADLIYQTQRLTLCQTSPAGCPGK